MSGYDDEFIKSWTDEQRLAFEGFMDLMVHFYLKYSSKVDDTVLNAKEKDSIVNEKDPTM